MFDVSLKDLQIAAAGILLIAYLYIRLERGMYKLLAD